MSNCKPPKQPNNNGNHKKFVWLAKIVGNIAYLPSGRAYDMRKDGWRRIK